MGDSSLFDIGLNHSWNFGLLRNEPYFIRGLRAFLAYTLICGLIIYSLFKLVVGPVQETVLPPVKTFHGPSLLLPHLNRLEAPVWRIFAVSNVTLIYLILYSVCDMAALGCARCEHVKYHCCWLHIFNQRNGPSGRWRYAMRSIQ